MVKLYLTWFAEPEDPHYWEFFKVDGLVVSLKSILRILERGGKSRLSRLLSEGFRRYYGYWGPLIIDSMLQPLHTGKTRTHPLSQADILYMQYLLGSDILVHRDHPLLGINDPDERRKLLMRNIVSAEAALRFGESLGKDVMLVVQGWDYGSYTECARAYRDLGVKYVGVGSLVPHRGDPEFIVRVVRGIREALGNHVHLHLFGISNINVLGSVGGLVDSVDVATPAIAAGKKEAILPKDGGFIRIKVSSVDGMISLRERLEVTSDETERRLIENIMNAGSLRARNRAVALYNAYVIMKYEKQLLIKIKTLNLINKHRGESA